MLHVCTQVYISIYDRTRGNDIKLRESRFRLDTRKKFFYNEGGETLGRVAQRSSGHVQVEVFKARLDGALSHLV